MDRQQRIVRRVAQLLVSRDVSPGSLAVALGLTPDELMSRLEHGFSVDELVVVADALTLPVVALLHVDGEVLP